MLTDLLANVLSSISSGWMRKRAKIVVPHTKFVESCLEVLSKTNCIGKIKPLGKNAYNAGHSMEICLKYMDGQAPYSKFAKISKCSLRKHSNVYSLKTIVRRYPHYLFVVSTNKGVMLASEAISKNLGGELLFKVM